MEQSRRRFIFINKNAGSGQLSRSSGIERSSIYRHAQPLHHAHPNETIGLQHSSRGERAGILTIGHQRRSIGEVAPPDVQTLVSLHGSPSPLPSYRCQLQGIFIDENISALRHQVDFAEIESFFWIRHVRRLPDYGDMVAISFTALAGAACGQDRGDQHLLHSAASAYVRALAKLSRNLSSPSGRASIEAVAAILALLMYQFFAPSDYGRQDWNIHIRGLGALVYSQAALIDVYNMLGLTYDMLALESSRNVLIPFTTQ